MCSSREGGVIRNQGLPAAGADSSMYMAACARGRSLLCLMSPFLSQQTSVQCLAGNAQKTGGNALVATCPA